MPNKTIQNRSLDFALMIIKLYKQLIEEKREYVIARQVLKSGTSIGANLHEADAAQSFNDFIAKVSIAFKEARETKYWLELLNKSGIIKLNSAITDECNNICNILARILITSKAKKATNSSS